MPASMSVTTKPLNLSHTKLPVSVPTYQDNSFVFAICNSFSYATIPSCISLFFLSFLIFHNPVVSVLLQCNSTPDSRFVYSERYYLFRVIKCLRTFFEGGILERVLLVKTGFNQNSLFLPRYRRMYCLFSPM